MSNNIYQQIWTADINDGNGIKAILASGDEEGSTNDGFIKVNESNITDGDVDHSLFKEVNIPESKRETFRLCQKLFDNYNLKDSDGETTNLKEWGEWSRFFFQTVVNSTPMKLAREFAESQEGRSFTDTEWITIFINLWIQPFAVGSSIARNGFEHVFVGEKRNKENIVGGYHFWYKFWLDDGGDIEGKRTKAKDDIDFKGLKYEGVDGFKVPEVATFSYLWDAVQGEESSNKLKKPTGGFFVGCSPEGLLALGTAAFFDNKRSDGEISNVNINGNEYDLKLFTDDKVGNGRGNHIDSFYPELIGVSKKPTIEEPAPSKVVISKALVNAENDGRTGELGNETVTLSNIGDSPADISNWKIAGNNGNASRNYFQIEASTILGVGQSREFTLADNAGKGPPSLKNGGGNIKLYSNTNGQVDVKTYSSQSGREGEEVVF